MVVENQYIETPKKTWEVFAVGMGFGQNMNDGESIILVNSSVTVIEVDSGNDVTEDLVKGTPYVQDENMLVAILTGGTNDTEYRVRFRAHITTDKKLQEDLNFVVRD